MIIYDEFGRHMLDTVDVIGGLQVGVYVTADTPITPTGVTTTNIYSPLDEAVNVMCVQNAYYGGSLSRYGDNQLNIACAASVSGTNPVCLSNIGC